MRAHTCIWCICMQLGLSTELGLYYIQYQIFLAQAPIHGPDTSSTIANIAAGISEATCCYLSMKSEKHMYRINHNTDNGAMMHLQRQPCVGSSSVAIRASSALLAASMRYGCASNRVIE